MARLLTIMGSGETAPTMVRTHRRVLEAAGGPAVMLDTPYGFQENADDITAKAQAYFRKSVGCDMQVASWRRPDDDTVVRERALARIAEATYVFAGPGSPTYALAQWRGTPLPGLLAEKLRSGGAVTFASAAALTLGVATVPVYEIYKVGQAPAWVPGLDLLGEIGLHVAVVPHFDNAEGGGHDTRFCYLGERRLAGLEPSLPEGAWVLGVDEHTALVLDLDGGTATVEGNGTVTVRRAGHTRSFPAGTFLPVEELTASARGAGPTAAPTTPLDRGAPATAPARSGPGVGADAARHEATFDAAVEARDVDAAVGAILDLEQALAEWAADTLQSDEADRARTTLRRMVVRLGDLARIGARDPRAVVAPYVEAVLGARQRARAARQYELADAIRDDLLATGVEVRDTPAGSDWVLPPG